MANGLARIGLGTVQMGLDYGISNANGKISPAGAAEILECAARAGIGMLDTAYLYGDSEKVLGRSLPAGHAFRIVTKTPYLEKLVKEAALPDGLLSRTFAESAERLFPGHSVKPGLYGLMLHSVDDLRSENGDTYLSDLLALKSAGLVRKIGVSVYDADDIDFVLSRFTPDIVQAPVNIADQRLVKSGHLKKLKQQGTEIHIRSLFLQGALLMDPENDVPHPYLRENLKKFSRDISGSGLSHMEACLSFGLNLEDADFLILGVSSRSELQGLIAAVETASQVALDYSPMAWEDSRYLNPANWN